LNGKKINHLWFSTPEVPNIELEVETLIDSQIDISVL
jgi:hypothetical protein